MDYITKSKNRLKQKLIESPNIFLDNDGFLFDNTDKMNDCAIFTLREIFNIDPLTFPRKKALENLKRFYKENLSVFNRVPWVASQSLELLEKGIKEDGENSCVSEFDIFRMSSRAYGGAFLYDLNINAENTFEKIKNFYEYNPEYYNHNKKRAEYSMDLFRTNIELYKGGLPSLSGENYIVGGITSRMVFETYLGIFFCKFDQEIKPIKGAKELISELNIFCKKQNKKFGVISNRSEDSLLELLNRHNFIGENMIPEEFITGADPILGGKPRLHTFRKFIPKKEKVVYFGDLPTDVEVCEVLNNTDGGNTAFCVLIPSKFEFSLDQNMNGEHNFNKKQNNFCICLPYNELLEAVKDL
jgi:phosphoglycolate phosphatase-like HAD superfamily hydrolase